MKKTILLSIFLLASCKNQDWGFKVRDFAFNEATGIIKDLSQKDLQIKWYNYFFAQSSYALAELNKANHMMSNFEELNLENLESDTLKLMSVSYKIDHQIQTLYEVNEAIYNANQSFQNSLNACGNQELFRIYTQNRSYLFSSLQMAMPQLNFSYSASITLPMGDGSTSSDSKEKGDTGIDAIPLIGNISTFFTEKKAKENKRKFQEGQDFINNIRLDSADLYKVSTQACINNRQKFEETFLILKSNIALEKESFAKFYQALSHLRNAISPLVIQNIINNFNSNDKLVYSVQKDSAFTTRMMEINQIQRQLSVSTFTGTVEEIEKIEAKIDLSEDILAELEMSKNSVLGIKNTKIITSLETLIKNKRSSLLDFLKRRY